ncbi:putative phospholipid-transporting ATPase NEO1 [Diplonema papillatum]|nr:putative phospholipid-transporting ATPase NEO1 [Diplonema papillatum]
MSSGELSDAVALTPMNDRVTHRSLSGLSGPPDYTHQQEEAGKPWWEPIRPALVAVGLASRAPMQERLLLVGPAPHDHSFPPNIVRNQKYSTLSFLPLSLYEQFKYFFNMYFLVVAISQFFPPLQVGFLFTYIAPLAFVVAVALFKESYDDFQRFLQDREANSEKYEAYTPAGTWKKIPSKDIKVGMLLKLKPNKRVPADCILLKTTEKDGSFVRTDQLDGETDWKLRIPVGFTQKEPFAAVPSLGASVWAQKPHDRIYDFVGKAFRSGESFQEGDPLTLENTLWANCVLATGEALVCVIYTGRETRASLNANTPTSKIGLLDLELNFMSKLLFVLTLVLALIMIIFQEFHGAWYISFNRFVILFSSIIPISLRVNLDIAKAVYSWFIMRDNKNLPGVVVRNSNLPEELGRIGYLFSDKTGTLTKNDMVFKKLFTGENVPKGWTHADAEDMREIVTSRHAAGGLQSKRSRTDSDLDSDRRMCDFTRATSEKQVDDLLAAFFALAAAHNVTPVVDSETQQKVYQASSPDEVALVQFCEASGLTLQYRDRSRMALGAAAKSVRVPKPAAGDLQKTATGVAFVAGEHKGWYLSAVRGAPIGTQDSVADIVARAAAPDTRPHDAAGTPSTPETLQYGTNCVETPPPHRPDAPLDDAVDLTVERRIELEILLEFPFTSESKRMGIVVRAADTKKVSLLMKGADTKMAEIVKKTAWLDEECLNLAREGLRTLVFGSKTLSEAEFAEFEAAHKEAMRSRDPKAAVEQVRARIEKDLDLVAVTGVEDKLQDDVAKSLEHLRKMGVKLWMLTGDKVETAVCIARSTRLAARDGAIFPQDCTGPRYEYLWDRPDGTPGWAPGRQVAGEEDALDLLCSFNRFVDSGAKMGGITLVVDGASLVHLLKTEEFVSAAARASSVVVARCSPTQKADVVDVMKRHTATAKIRTAAIGDGGNDVSMILAAHVGLGIEGKEGRHASLAADYSLTKFCHCVRLLNWHGRNSYKRSARLGQFVIHRGLIISFIQAIFSAIFYFMAVPIYTGWLLVGYSTVYTMCPVFAIVLDEDVDESAADEFPELYRELQKARALSLRTFLQWVFKAIYQGAAIMLLAIYFFDRSFLRIVTITFTALILTELITIWFEMHKISFLFALAEVATLASYVISFFFIASLDLQYVTSGGDFWWKSGIITLTATGPVVLAKLAEQMCCQPSYAKLRVRNDPWIVGLLYDAYRWCRDTCSRSSQGFPHAARQPLV